MSEKKPLVSICIPTYKRYDQLRVCMQNALGQDYENIEVLVSDDTQDEPVPYWLVKLSEIDRRLRYVKQPFTLGMMANDTFVRENSNGDYLCVMHNDDEFPNNYISSMMNVLISNTSCSLAGPSCVRYLNGKYWHDYEIYSQIGMTQYERLKDITARVFDNPWGFEHLMYGVYKRDAVPKSFQFGRWRSIILFLYLCSINGAIHTIKDINIKKHTTTDDFQKYAIASYVECYPVLAKFFCRRQEERLTALYRLVKFTLKSKEIKWADKLSLISLSVKHCMRNRIEFFYERPVDAD